VPGIVDEAVDAYIDALAHRGGAELAAWEDVGREEGWPIVGAAEGSFLHILARIVGARRVLELGTAIGYSTTWLARALAPGGELVTVEADGGTAHRAREHLERMGLGDRVTILIGRAEELLDDLAGPYDFVFNDIDKEGYPAVLEPCIRLLRVGGLLVTDNVLWSGRVARKSADGAASAIREYNRRLADDPRMLTAIVPLRDGVSVALKTRE
jgi:predicted O-methyltransferase YrrM